MKTYSQFRPTGYDSHINIDSDESRENWLVAPVSRNRDSGPLTESNFASALRSLGGESDTVEVHRFGHWGPGWYEIILIAPESDAARIGEELECALSDCVALDESDLSEREREDYMQGWEQYGKRDFVRSLVRAFKTEQDNPSGQIYTMRLADTTTDFLDDCDSDALLSFVESLIPSGEYYTLYSDGVSIRTDTAVRNATRDKLAAFIREQRNYPVTA